MADDVIQKLRELKFEINSLANETHLVKNLSDKVSAKILEEVKRWK